MSQIQKLIWDHCFVSRTSTVMAAWLDRMAIKHGEAPFPIGCLIYTVCITVCSLCLIYTLRRIIFYRIIYYASLQSQKWFLWHFYWSVNIEGPWKLIWEHGKYKNDSLTAHNHFKTRNRSTVTAEVYLPPLSLPPPASEASSPRGGQCKDHEVKRNQSGTHITLCLPPFSFPAGWQGLSGLTWVESDSNCHLHRQGSAAMLKAQAKYT